MQEIKKRPQPGEVWKTVNGHRVRVLAGRSHDLIETAYVDGRVNGYLGANFYADTRLAVRDNDRLEECAK
jgi:hypothetical protein